jgi:hypothetical protein
MRLPQSFTAAILNYLGPMPRPGPEYDILPIH